MTDTKATVRLAEYLLRTTAAGSEMYKLALDVLMAEAGPCKATWHEVKCQWWAGHPSNHHGNVDEQNYASWVG